jgi:hypothetical protein
VQVQDHQSVRGAICSRLLNQGGQPFRGEAADERPLLVVPPQVSRPGGQAAITQVNPVLAVVGVAGEGSTVVVARALGAGLVLDELDTRGCVQDRGHHGVGEPLLQDRGVQRGEGESYISFGKQGRQGRVP